jgi:phosphorylcholine metabolism protein LicD
MKVLRELPHAPEVLAAGADLLDGLDLTWWLSSGTALGVWRDGGLIAHDTDLDVGVLDKPGVFALLDQAFRAAGFVDYRQTGYQRAYLYREVIFDVYVYRRENDQLVAYTEVGRLAKPARLFDDLTTLEFAGRIYPMPNPPDEYLRVRYGPAWHTPATHKRPWTSETEALTRS